MKIKYHYVIFGILLLWPIGAMAGSLTSDQVMDKLEARYNVKGIFANFHQASELKAMEVSDTAEGRIYIKRPGRMRWEYDTPVKQSIITDGQTIWLYYPEDKQVMTGKAATFFGEGGGSVFLSDISSIRKYFTVVLIPDASSPHHILKLTPNNSENDGQAIVLTVSEKTFDILQVVTRNAYGDETRHTFEGARFDQDLEDGMFTFSPPEGTEVLPMDE